MVLELDEGDRWVVEIDLSTEEVIEVEPVHVAELGCIFSS